MKKKAVAIVVVIVLLTVALAGCARSADSASELISVRLRATGETVSIGYTKNQVTSVTGKDEDHGLEFLEDGVERIEYRDAPGLLVDYLDDKVVALYLLYNDNWELMNGVHIGMDKAEVEKLYADIPEREVGSKGGIFISYDENENPIPMDEFSPYVLKISYVDDKVDVVIISSSF